MAETAAAHLILSTLLPSPPPPPPPPNSTGSPPPPPPLLFPAIPTPRPSVASRRTASLFLLSLVPSSISSPSPAAALGIPGPKEWLKGQKKKASRFILAPIEASRGRLQAAYLALASSEIGEIRNLIGSASRDCVADERSSIVAFQARTGVEVCTFRLLVKNAASLLDERDPVKLETEAMLDELIRSFASLGVLVDNSDLQVAYEREKVEAGLRDTMSALDGFEQGIKQCIGV